MFETKLDWIYSSSVALSVTTNVVITSLTAYKLWHVSSLWTVDNTSPILVSIRTYRKFMINNLNLNQRHSPVQKTLFLLVESGAFYCALQVVLSNWAIDHELIFQCSSRIS